MMDHEEARTLVSARTDGEPSSPDEARLAELDDHLAACTRCRAFAAALPRVSALAKSLPRVHAPRSLSDRVRTGLARSRHRTSARKRSLVSGLAAAAVVAIVALLVGSITIISVPRADAAEALSRIETMVMEREISSFGEDGRLESVTVEKIWFKAPGLVRIETRSGAERTIVIERPDARYREAAGGRIVETGRLPSIASLPEPLTPTLALLGMDVGAGPDVAGRPTRRVRLDLEGQRRVALVDVRTFAVVGAEESVILGKEAFEGGRLLSRKRTISVDYNVDIPDRLFLIPGDAPRMSFGADARPLGTISAPPVGRLDGVELVTAAAGPQGEAILYGKGAFQILVEIDGPTEEPSPAGRRRTAVGDRQATLILPLFGLPEIRFMEAGHRVSILAALTPDRLVELAERMYP